MAYGNARRDDFEQRSEDREQVHYRARGFGADARSLSLLIVNLSPHGLMARCDGNFAPGERLRIALPVVGVIVAEVRWALGGRIGCHLEQGIDRASYYELLAAMLGR